MEESWTGSGWKRQAYTYNPYVVYSMKEIASNVGAAKAAFPICCKLCRRLRSSSPVRGPESSLLRRNHIFQVDVIVT